MLFAVICIDKQGRSEVRAANRPDHLAYLTEFAGRVVLAGPFISDDGEDMQGSLLVMDFDDRAAAEAFAANDPYNKAGLFESVTVRRWKKVLPAD